MKVFGHQSDLVAPCSRHESPLIPQYVLLLLVTCVDGHSCMRYEHGEQRYASTCDMLHIDVSELSKCL